MREIGRYIYLVALVVLTAACGSSSREQRLQDRQTAAERQTAVLCEALDRGASLDSIRSIAERDPNVLFYVFDARQMVYWSSNRLASDAVYLTAYDTWRDQRFSNAQARVRWTRVGVYNVLTVLPISYTELQDYTDISSIASQTFSFRQLLESNRKPYASSRFYFFLCHALFVLIILLGIWGLIRNKGIRNMRLSTRIIYIILVPVMAVFIYVFFMSIRYVDRNYEQHQRHDLQMRSEYIQSYLRSLY